MHIPNRKTGLSLLSGAVGVLLVAILLAAGASVSAQTPSPATSPEAAVCDVEPRSEQELAKLASLAATPMTGTPEAVDGSMWIEGTPADPETLAALQRTLDLIAACSTAGDVARLLALYTDDYILREFLAIEPVPILPGTPDVTAVSGTPTAGEQSPMIERAHVLDEGSVVAVVKRDGRSEMMVFVQEDGMWLVDAVETVTGDAATPDSGVSDELASLPPVRAAVADAAEAAGVSVGEVSVIAVESTVWPDSSLGCPQPDQFYAQVETPGYFVTLDVAGTAVTYHSDEGDAAVPCVGEK